MPSLRGKCILMKLASVTVVGLLIKILRHRAKSLYPPYKRRDERVARVLLLKLASWVLL